MVHCAKPNQTLRTFSRIYKHAQYHLPIVVGLTVDEPVTGGTVVIPGGSASEGRKMQFDAPTVKEMSSRAMSPL